MAQNFWTAIFAWTTCFVVTIVSRSRTQRNKTDDEFAGLVYSLTPRVKKMGGLVSTAGGAGASSYWSRRSC